MKKIDKGILWTIGVGIIGVVAGYYINIILGKGALPVYAINDKNINNANQGLKHPN